MSGKVHEEGIWRAWLHLRRAQREVGRPHRALLRVGQRDGRCLAAPSSLTSCPKACNLALALQGDYVLQGGNVSGEVQVWHLGATMPQLVGVFHGNAGSITSLRCLPEQGAIVSGSTGGSGGADSLVIRWRPHLFA